MANNKSDIFAILPDNLSSTGGGSWFTEWKKLTPHERRFGIVKPSGRKRKLLKG